MKKSLLSLLILWMAVTAQLSAQATLSLQGVIKNSDGTAVENGNYSLTFRLYNVDAGGTPVWEETQDAVSVRGGVYSVLMGESEPLTAAFDETYFLGISVDGGAELVPRTRLTSSPYALALIGNSNVFASDGNVGIGTTSPNEKLEVIGNLKVDGNLEFTGNVTGNLGIDLSNLDQDVGTTGNVSADGNVSATNINATGNISATGNITLKNGMNAAAGQEQLRIIRGSFNGAGAIASGAGFTVTRTGTGTYRVTFSTSFSGFPSVMANSPQHKTVVTSVSSIGSTSFIVTLINPVSNAYVNGDVNFIAIGAK